MATPNLELKARDLMQTRIVAVTRQYGARDLSILIHSSTFRGVPVIEPGNHLVGMVTEFDVLKALVQGKDLHKLKAEDVMTPHPVSVEETTTAEEIINLMVEHQIIRIPVVRENKLLGLVSRTDLFNCLIDDHLINVYGG
jgi:CBS domain-containing protein